MTFNFHFRSWLEWQFLKNLLLDILVPCAVDYLKFGMNCTTALFWYQHFKFEARNNFFISTVNVKRNILMLVFVIGETFTMVFYLNWFFFFYPCRTYITLQRVVKIYIMSFSRSLLYTQIELIDRVDDIYRNTSWDNAGFKGYGIQIEQVFINGCGL